MRQNATDNIPFESPIPAGSAQEPLANAVACVEAVQNIPQGDSGNADLDVGGVTLPWVLLLMFLVGFLQAVGVDCWRAVRREVSGWMQSRKKAAPPNDDDEKAATTRSRGGKDRRDPERTSAGQ